MTEKPDNRDPEATQTGRHRMVAVGEVLGGRYEVLELVGSGGMGMVYRARDRRLDVDVALKVLVPDRAADRETLARFERELVLARQVSHPNVVRIHDIGQEGDLHFLTMDYVAGRSLKEVMAQEGALPAERAVTVARDLARGLGAAHDRGVVHRDLKPANVLLDEDGRARITDFGVARSLATPGPTRPGNILGTPFYLSPEQALGEPVDGRSDIYALGLLLYEMLSGELPFSAESFDESLAQRVTGRPAPLPAEVAEVPVWLKAVIQRCLARNPEQRYPDAAALLADLEAGRASSASLRMSRRVWLGAGAVVLLALAAAGVWRYGVPERGAPQQAGPETAESPAAESAHTVAVLPFLDETGQATLGWVRTGVAEMLAVSLAEAPALYVVDSMRVFRTLEDLGMDPARLTENEARQLATLLDAERLVSGRVRSAGDALRLDMTLTAPADSGVGPQRFGASAPGAAGLLEAVEGLSGELLAALRTGAPKQPETALSAAPAALAAFGEGVEKLIQGDSIGAIPALESAVEADPEFAAAWARLSEAYRAVGYGDRARQAVDRAIEELDRADGRIALEVRARRAGMAGDMDRALALRRELVERFPNDIEARVNLGELQGDSGRLDDARQTLRAVVERNANHPRAWYLLGKFSILAGEHRIAIDDYLVRALVIQNRLDNAQGKADVLNAMGIAYAQLGELASAQENYERAAEMRQAIGDRRGVAATLSNLAKIQVSRGDLDGARARLEQALEIQRDIGDRAGVAYLHNEFGLLEEERGRYAEALSHYRDALRVRQDLGDERALADSYNNVGFGYLQLGEYDNAALYARQALERYQASGNREGMMLARQTLGLLETARGNWEAALSAALAALEVSRELELRGASAVLLGIIGRVARHQGRYAAAMDSYDEAARLVQELGNPRGQAEYALERAALLLEVNEIEAAAAALEVAGEHVSAGGNLEQRARLTRLRGEADLARGEMGAARETLQRGIEEARTSGSTTAVMRAELALARALLAAGDPPRAGRMARENAERAGAIGHAVLQLEALELAARAARSAGAEDEARGLYSDALELVRSHRPYGREWRLHLGRAELAGNGDAQAHFAAAAEAFARVQSNVPEEMMQAFDAQPEVIRLHDRQAATAH